MRTPARIVVASALALGLAAPAARAQGFADTPATVPTAIAVVPAGPSLQALPAGVQRAAAPRDSSISSAARGNAGLGQPEAMMIVGGAALIVGAIVGDTPGEIIMIGGAIIGLVGLYKYLQ